MLNNDYIDVLLMGNSKCVFPSMLKDIAEKSLKLGEKWRFDKNLMDGLENNAKIISGVFFYDECIKTPTDLICLTLTREGYTKYVLGKNYDKIMNMKKYAYLSDDGEIATLLLARIDTSHPWTIFADDYNEKLIFLNPQKAYFNNYYLL